MPSGYFATPFVNTFSAYPHLLHTMIKERVPFAVTNVIVTAIDENCQVICCSALLTTTMTVMEDVVKVAEAAGIRDKVKIMIGGAPVSKEYCDKIGADCYTVDAASAADAAVEFCKNVIG